MDISPIIKECDDGLIFNYCLNEENARLKLLESARRKDCVTKEQKSNCVNYIFSGGAFFLILNLLKKLEGKVDLEVEGEKVDLIEYDKRTEMSGKNVDSKIVFNVNMNETEKVVLHIYNTVQKITISGKRYKWFVDSFFEPYISKSIEENETEISEINNHILTNQLPKSSPHGENELDKDNDGSIVSSICVSCDTIIKDDKALDCIKCCSRYHKKCSPFRSDKTRQWKPQSWTCKSLMME